MPINPNLRRTAVLIISGFLILIFSAGVYAQRTQRLEAPNALLELLHKEDRDCVTQSGLNKSVTVRRIRLARDRTQQILIRGAGLCLCGAQNCGFWIYRKTGGDYKLLLQGTGSVKVTIGRQSARGYRDVISYSHASAAETIIRTYRYDGSQYQLQRCVDSANYDDNGKYIKKPISRPCDEANQPQRLKQNSRNDQPDAKG